MTYNPDLSVDTGWPVKEGPLVAVGLLGHGGADIPDCDRCLIADRCAGYRPLDASTPTPPCKLYRSYAEYEKTLAT